MHKNQRGFSTVEGLLILVIVGMIGFVGWYAWSSNNRTNEILKSTGKIGSEKTTTPTKPSGCINGVIYNNGIIMVQFKASSKEQQQNIISQEGATIYQEYDTLPGLYYLNVTKGKEQQAINAFLKHPEVQAANLEGCGTTTNRP